MRSIFGKVVAIHPHYIHDKFVHDELVRLKEKWKVHAPRVCQSESLAHAVRVHLAFRTLQVLGQQSGFIKARNIQREVFSKLGMDPSIYEPMSFTYMTRNDGADVWGNIGCLRELSEVLNEMQRDPFWSSVINDLLLFGSMCRNNDPILHLQHPHAAAEHYRGMVAARGAVLSDGQRIAHALIREQVPMHHYSRGNISSDRLTTCVQRLGYVSSALELNGRGSEYVTALWFIYGYCSAVADRTVSAVLAPRDLAMLRYFWHARKLLPTGRREFFLHHEDISAWMDEKPVFLEGTAASEVRHRLSSFGLEDVKVGLPVLDDYFGEVHFISGQRRITDQKYLRTLLRKLLSEVRTYRKDGYDVDKIVLIPEGNDGEAFFDEENRSVSVLIRDERLSGDPRKKGRNTGRRS